MTSRYWVACIVTALLAAIAPAVLWNGGTMEREPTTFIPQYTDDRPVLQKVFDPHKNDWGTFQARELSYFFDYLDAIAYRFLYRTFHVAVFIPLSSVLASVLLSFVFFRGVSRTATSIDPWTAALLFGCLASSFVFVSTMAVFYRSAKAMLAVALLALLFHVHGADRRQRDADGRRRMITRNSVLTCALGVAAGSFDRQGFVYVLAACAIVGLHALWTRRLWDVLLGLIVASGILVAYNYVVAPVAIQALNGYRPSFSYQRVPLLEPDVLAVYTILAAKMLVENAALLAGGSYLTAALLLGGLVAVLLLCGGSTTPSRWASSVDIRRRLSSQPSRRVVVYFALAFVAQVVMFALMIVRHPYVYAYLDHRYWYYPLPFAMTVIFGAVLLFNAVIPLRTPAVLPVVRGLLAAIVVTNIALIPAHRQVMEAGNWFKPVSGQSAALARSLESGHADPLLDPDYSRFFRQHAGWSSK